MLSAETVQACEKDNIPALSAALSAADVAQLVEWLAEKDDNLRYKSFLLLQARSQACADVFAHWDAFVARLASANSYQRSLGLMLIAENARWDDSGAFAAVLERYLAGCDDEKPVTVRQCIQGLCKIVPYQPACLGPITEKLLSIDLVTRKDTQRKLLLMDILSVLAEIRKIQPDERIERYFLHAMTGGILDEKAKKQIAGVFR